MNKIWWSAKLDKLVLLFRNLILNDLDLDISGMIAEIYWNFALGADIICVAPEPGQILQVSSNAAIDVMQTAEDWLAYDLAVWLIRAVDRRIFIERHVRSAGVVIIDVFCQHAC